MERLIYSDDRIALSLNDFSGQQLSGENICTADSRSRLRYPVKNRHMTEAVQLFTQMLLEVDRLCRDGGCTGEWHYTGTFSLRRGGYTLWVFENYGSMRFLRKQVKSLFALTEQERRAAQRISEEDVRFALARAAAEDVVLPTRLLHAMNENPHLDLDETASELHALVRGE